MKCLRCQHENPTGMKFCGECAAPLASTCPSCGAANPPENKFCGQCATPLRTTPTTKFAAPDSYTPKHLAERILTSKAALEGERKQVTVLFADLKGSMELLADRDPEEARKLLDPVLEHMMEAVHRYEGTVNQVMGDGIMALFGAPLAYEDHAVRACYAALRMQESVKRYTDGVRRQDGVSIRIRDLLKAYFKVYDRETHREVREKVIGKDVPFSLLLAIAELGEEDVRRGLARLQTAEFLYETSLFPELEYTFKHALTHEVAYGSLLHERRRARHARIVDTLEAIHDDRPQGQVEPLAHHAYRGEQWEKAARYARLAGDEAAARSAHRQVIELYQQAIHALGHMPEAREVVLADASREGRVRSSARMVWLGEAALAAGALPQAREHAEVALALSREQTAGGAEAWSLYLLGAINAGEEPASVTASEDHYRLGLARAEALGMRPLIAHCHLGLGELYRRTGKREQAREHFSTATALYREMDMRFWLDQAEAEIRGVV